MGLFACGVVSSGVSIRWGAALVGVALAGPLVCATSQAVNDWFDRDVDAINEPRRPIPSGRIPGRWGLYIGYLLDRPVARRRLDARALGARRRDRRTGARLGLQRAAVSAEAERLVGQFGGRPSPTKAPLVHRRGGHGRRACRRSGVILFALLYSIGAHGIMTLNDFKSIEGDKLMGVRSLPVQLGVANAVRSPAS